MARTMFKRRPRDNRVRDERRRMRAEEATMQQRQRIDLALKHFNDSNNEGTEYEFVRDAGCGTGLYCSEWFRHINFLAKPKGASDNEVKLFFAEIKSSSLMPPVVISCSIVGPEGVVTGARGCKACDYGRELLPEKAVVQHPVDGCGSVRYGYEWFKHINFLAKPKGASDNEVKLFFAEIQKGVVTPPVVISCSILGPEGVVTGARGCKACDYGGKLPPEKAVVQHPVDGKFTRGLYAPTAFTQFDD